MVSIGQQQVGTLDLWGEAGPGTDLREEISKKVVATGAVAPAGAGKCVVAARIHGRVAQAAEAPGRTDLDE